MTKKNLLLIIFIVSLTLSISLSVSASRVEFDALGKCNVQGTIKSVSFEKSYEDPCVKDNSCPVGAFTPEKPARYILGVNIATLSCTPGEGDNQNTYESQFKLNTENSIILNSASIKNGDQLKQGGKINGTVEYIANEHTFTAYELEKMPVKPKEKNLIDENEKTIIANGKINYTPYFIIVAILIIIPITIGIFLKKRI